MKMMMMMRVSGNDLGLVLGGRADGNYHRGSGGERTLHGTTVQQRPTTQGIPFEPQESRGFWGSASPIVLMTIAVLAIVFVHSIVTRPSPKSHASFVAPTAQAVGLGRVPVPKAGVR